MTGDGTLRLPADYASLRDIGPWLRSVLEPIGDERIDASLGSIELAVHELATNSVDHARSPDGELVLHAELSGEVLLVELSDHGAPFVADHVIRPDESTPQVRGYGLMIIEQLASSLHYDRIDDRNIWTAGFDL